VKRQGKIQIYVEGEYAPELTDDLKYCRLYTAKPAHAAQGMHLHKSNRMTFLSAVVLCFKSKMMDIENAKL